MHEHPQAVPFINTDRNEVWVHGRAMPIRMVLNNPNVVLIDGFMTSSECETLIVRADMRMRPSPVVDDTSGGQASNSGRTSNGAMFQQFEDEFVSIIDNRVADLVQWPAVNGEGLQVVQYMPGQQYTPHYDWFNPTMEGPRKHLARGGQRVATVILYLSDVETGGSTNFTNLGLDIRPYRGSALFFRNTDDRIVGDLQTLHSGQPVIKGVKYIANKWFRERPFV